MPTSETTRACRYGHTRFRPPEPPDGQVMWALAARVGLDLNSAYAYVMWSDHHATTSVVAEADDEIVGFALAFRLPAEPDALFVWQIGVDERARGAGIAGRMLDELVARVGPSVVEATVTPGNRASMALFGALGARHGSTVARTMAYDGDLFPAGHEAEIRLRIPVGG